MLISHPINCQNVPNMLKLMLKPCKILPNILLKFGFSSTKFKFKSSVSGSGSTEFYFQNSGFGSGLTEFKIENSVSGSGKQNINSFVPYLQCVYPAAHA